MNTDKPGKEAKKEQNGVKDQKAIKREADKKPCLPFDNKDEYGNSIGLDGF